MTGWVREHWRSFAGSEPGRRFRDRYRRQGGGGFAPRRVLAVVAGIAMMLAGLVLVPAPGPGWAVFFVGLWICAGEFLFIARFMDAAEVKSRELGRRFAGLWETLPVAAKVAAALVVLVCTVAAAYAAYRLIFG